MGLGGRATHVTRVANRDELKEAWSWAKARDIPSLVIGGGSNIVWRDEGFDGLLIVNQIQGVEISEHDEDFIFKIGAGEVWDEVVKRSVIRGLTGIEALSLIPGSAGATPVQNVGAYGQEISQTLTELEALDTTSGEFVTLNNEECSFGYRDSRFKTGEDRGRYCITSISLRLTRGTPAPPFYGSLERYLKQHEITTYTPQSIREAVVDIRSHKLPDPAKIHNTGSFFANPIVTETQLARLQADYPDIPNWPAVDGGTKIAGAWLIEQAGYKNMRDESTGMATWPTQPLVLVNENAKSTADLLAFKQKLVDAVDKKFGITLEQEPELLP
jgi:UDP-N-acetylmuramate dehydrogenase